MRRQCTVEAPVELGGIGLHTGAQVKMRLLPATVGTGRVFVRTDLAGRPEIPAHVDRVCSTPRGTNLALDGDENAVVHTVEHVLAALRGCGVDNAIIELDGPEPPAMDGSAAPLVRAIDAVGVVEQKVAPRLFRLNEPVHFRDGNAELVYLPSDDDLRVTFNIDFPHPMLGAGTVSEPIGNFRDRIAEARTFCFEHEVEMLRAEGLIRGGSLDNALVFGDDGLLNPEPLRFADEPARHKLLDLIGDLALIPDRIQGHVIALRAGHAANVKFAKALLRARQRESGGLHDVQEVMKHIPQRYPFLMIDRILEMEPAKHLVAVKNVTANEPFFQGHFPGRPVMPGVMILEAMAQASVYLLHRSKPEFKDRLFFFAGIDGVRFRRAVVPGDQLQIEVWIQRMQRLSTTTVRATVSGMLVCEAKLQALCESPERGAPA